MRVLLQKHVNWLSVEARGIQNSFILIVSILILDFVISFLFALLIIYNKIDLPASKALENYLSKPGYIIFSSVFIFAMLEETIFRFIPLNMVYRRAKKENRPFYFVVVVVLSSICFGYAHGTFYNIFTQGTGGYLYCLAFLKLGGYHGKTIKPLFATCFLHFLSNAIIILPRL